MPTTTRSLLALALLAAGCTASAAAKDRAAPEACEDCADDEGGACAVPPDVPDTPGARSLLDAPLAVCSTEPRTGFFRSGRCETGPMDRGVHVVCAQVTREFLEYSRNRGNDLIRARPEVGFPGLEPGDRWCLCAARWREAAEADVAPPVILEATHEAAARHVSPALLRRHALR